ncbi:MAG: hypothetical protein EOP04_06510, partial [Proteobacteria bacterium]
MKILVFALFALMATSCSDSKVVDVPIAKDANTSSTSKTAEEAGVDRPVVITGSYLACSQIGETDSTSNEISMACRVGTLDNRRLNSDHKKTFTVKLPSTSDTIVSERFGSEQSAYDYYFTVRSETLETKTIVLAKTV